MPSDKSSDPIELIVDRSSHRWPGPEGVPDLKCDRGPSTPYTFWHGGPQGIARRAWGKIAKRSDEDEDILGNAPHLDHAARYDTHGVCVSRVCSPHSFEPR